MNSIDYVDELIIDYFSFRGYLRTRETFLLEKEKDFLKGFSPHKIVTYISNLLEENYLDNFLEIWEYLDEKYFSQMPNEIKETTYLYKTSLLKYYLIMAIKKDNKKALKYFFKKFSDDLLTSAEWISWAKLLAACFADDDVSLILLYYSHTYTQKKKNIINGFFKKKIRFTKRKEPFKRE